MLDDALDAHWLHALAADVNAPRPIGPEDVVQIINAALERKLMNPLPLRRAPHLSNDLDEQLRQVYADELGVDIPPPHHIGRCALDASTADVRDILSFGDAYGIGGGSCCSGSGSLHSSPVGSMSMEL